MYFKVAKIFHMFKKGHMNLTDIYRLIAIIVYWTKILEVILKYKTFDSLEKKQFIKLLLVCVQFTYIHDEGTAF